VRNSFIKLWLSKGLSKNKIVNLRDVTQVNLFKIIHVILGQTLKQLVILRFGESGQPPKQKGAPIAQRPFLLSLLPTDSR